MDCVALNRAEKNQITISYMHLSLPSAVQRKGKEKGASRFMMQGLKCCICSSFPVMAQRHFIVAFKEEL